MNGKLYSLPVKTAAAMLFVVITIVTGLFGVAFIYMCSGAGYYNDENPDGSFYNSEICSTLMWSRYSGVYQTLANRADMDYSDINDYFAAIQNDLAAQNETAYLNSVIRLTITDSMGNPVYSYGSAPEKYGAKINSTSFINLNGKRYTAEIYVFVRDTFIYGVDNFSEYKRYFDLFYSIRYAAIVITALGAVGMVSLYVFMLKAAGRRYGEEGVKPGFFERVPYDLYLAVTIFIAAIIILATADNPLHYYWPGPTGTFYMAIAVVSVICVPLLLLFLALSSTTAVRIKTHSLLRNTVIWRLCALVWRFCLAIRRALRSLFKMIPAAAKAALSFPVFIIADVLLAGIFINAGNIGNPFTAIVAFLLLCALNLAAYALIIRSTYELVLLRRGSGRLAAGELDYKFNESRLHGEVKKISQSLNRMSEGMTAAVEQRSKSERMKAELITNVSHDLKTPITSIINYVDLLKKEPMQTEAAAGYLAVLDRQSARLRKLTADLVEASKASTGNVEVTLAPTDLCELLDQSAAEYAARFAEAGLVPVIRVPGDPVLIRADGKLLWRVLDNLLSNICKYSQPGTRVYLDATSGERMAGVVMRNISAVQLGGVSPDELTERFVRGDSARSGEGSGLGLSIARSLTELQGGHLAIEIDGDMFKVSVVFDRI